MKWFPVLLVVFGSVTLFSLVLWLFHLLTVDLGIKV